MVVQFGGFCFNDWSHRTSLEKSLSLELASINIVRAIYQENKGHGGVWSIGLADASGRYFKVVDSDDWWISSCLLENS